MKAAVVFRPTGPSHLLLKSLWRACFFQIPKDLEVVVFAKDLEHVPVLNLFSSQLKWTHYQFEDGSETTVKNEVEAYDAVILQDERVLPWQGTYDAMLAAEGRVFASVFEFPAFYLDAIGAYSQNIKESWIEQAMKTPIQSQFFQDDANEILLQKCGLGETVFVDEPAFKLPIDLSPSLSPTLTSVSYDSPIRILQRTTNQ